MTDVTQQLISALREIARGEEEDFDGALRETVMVPMSGERAGEIAHQALTAYEASRAAPDDVVERVGKAICAEKCAYMGEPACWTFKEETWPPPTCDEPGCIHEARAALSALPARDDALEGLRELSERATRGPWRTNSMTTFGEDWPIGTVMDCGTADEKHRSLVTTDGVRASALGESSAETDAALIAAAVNYVRAKLAAPAQESRS